MTLMLRNRIATMLLKMWQDASIIKLFYGLVVMQTFGQVDSAWTKNITSASVYGGPYALQNALDGNPSRDAQNCRCCAATTYALNSWYQLDFGENHTVNRIHVEGRTDNPNYSQHFQGMQIYLKSVNDGIGFGEETTITDATFNVDYVLPVPKSTRYISLALYDIKRVFTVCELTVYGDCTDGTFGGYCESICHCEVDLCNTPTGECPSWKCLPGYYGTACHKECTGGTFGGYCEDICLCEGDPCNTQTGECPSGTCLPGYYGTTCDKECSDGTYGSGCTEKCNNCVGNDICNKKDGRCPGQCAIGYQGYTCKEECDDGFYGQGCTNTCGDCHNGEPCYVVTGYCVNGCAAGYQLDSLCKTECIPGTFGVECSNQCGSCKGGPTICAKTDGFCPAGCVAGYKGGICQTECDDGTYGENCNSNCGNCLNGAACDKKTGACVDGCSAGYTGDLCVDECPRNSYGIGCGSKCENCVTNACHHIHGACIGGCTAGFKAPLCQDVCEDGFYGPSCVLVCGNCQDGESCDKRLGYCIYGCSDGYQPDLLCKTEMVDNAYLSLAISGWVCVGIVVLASAAGIFVLMRNRKGSNQKKVRAASRMYEIPTIRTDPVIDEHPYSSTEVNTQDHVYTNTELS